MFSYLHWSAVKQEAVHQGSASEENWTTISLSHNDQLLITLKVFLRGWEISYKKQSRHIVYDVVTNIKLKNKNYNNMYVWRNQILHLFHEMHLHVHVMPMSLKSIIQIFQTNVFLFPVFLFSQFQPPVLPHWDATDNSFEDY